MARRGTWTRVIAWSTLVASLAVLFLDQLGGINLQAGILLKGVILFGAGLMMLFETFFTKGMDWENPNSVNFLVGVPSGVIAVLLGISYIARINPVIELLGGFEGGIYLAGIIILAYEGITAATGKNIHLSDLGDN
jgi:hypothetical protein